MPPSVRYVVAVMVLVFSIITAARADVIWPPAVYYAGVLTWWIILFGLLVEYPFYFMGFRLGWRRSAIATVAANLFSTLVGLLIWYPIAFPMKGLRGLIGPFFGLSSVNPVLYCIGIFSAF